MNTKEISEIRRRFSPDKNAISHIYGCYVNSNREVISYIDESLGVIPQDEAEKYLSLMKKGLSGSLGKNLIDIVFSTNQVMDSDEHRLLSALRSTQLRDGEVRQAFFQKVIDSLDMEDSNYIILLVHDSYDVPRRGKDGERDSYNSDEVFSYIVCSICPVKDGKTELGYFPGENEFHSCAAGQIVASPELGFMFPAFDDRAANIYNALFYSRNSGAIHHEFIDAVFNTEPPMSASAQKEAFSLALSESLEEDCSFDIVQTVHGELCDRIAQHKESGEEEPLSLTVQEIGGILSDCGVAQEKVETFREKCTEQFGDGAVLSPENIIESKRFEVKTQEMSVTASSEYSYLVETRIINGRKYLLIPADGDVEINGLEVKIPVEKELSTSSSSI